MRVLSPSRVSRRTSRFARSCPSTTMLPRQLAMRKIRWGTPSRGVMTALALKRTRAEGRANLAKVTPVTSATASVPTRASTTTTACPKRVAGDMAP